MSEVNLSLDCTLLQQSILNRYPLVLVECEERTDFNLVRLRLKPDSSPKTVRITVEDYLDGDWETKVETAVRELYTI